SRLVSVNSTGTGPGNRDSYSPLLSSDARYVLFRSRATTLTSDFVTGFENLFFADLQPGTNYALTTSGVGDATMTPDGHFVAFLSSVPFNGPLILYVWDSQLHSKIYTNANTGLSQVALSPDGRWLLYVTTGLYATDLATGTNILITSS